MATTFKPYVFFYGRCEEALEFYQAIFGGSYELMRVGDVPQTHDAPSQAHDASPQAMQRVMHASFTSDTVAFMASDGGDSKAVDTNAGNISLALQFDDASRGEAIFAKLSDAGSIDMPLDVAFWGGRFGIATDRFGTEWMVSLP
jgi:PhnB protein